MPATDGAAVEVAIGDLNGDGRGELVTGRVAGGEPWLEVLDGASGARLHGVRGREASYAGGLHVAAGDIDADGRDEVVTGTGNDGDGLVRVYDGALHPIRAFPAFSWRWPGIYVAVRRTAGLPLVAFPRTVRVATGNRRAYVVASFRDAGSSRRRFDASIRWGDGAVTPAGVRARGGGGVYDVLATRRFTRPGRRAAAVTLGDGARASVARSTVLVMRR